MNFDEFWEKETGPGHFAGMPTPKDLARAAWNRATELERQTKGAELVEPTLVQSIAGKIRDAGDVLVLDEVIQDAFAGRASEVNNQGLETQIRYLLTVGEDEQGILEKAGISMPACRI